jgi:pimeloyl-ACP methyl ester carboxylesterase
MSSLFASQLPLALRQPAGRRLRNPLVEDRELLRLALYGARHHRSRLLRPEPPTDAQLESIAAPTHIVLAARSEAFPVNKARARAALLPDATTDVISGAGHAVAVSHVDTLAAEVARHDDTASHKVEHPEPA